MVAQVRQPAAGIWLLPLVLSCYVALASHLASLTLRILICNMGMRASRAGFLNLNTVDVLGWTSPGGGDSPMHCRNFYFIIIKH